MHPVHGMYRLVRRLGFIDVTRLMHVDRIDQLEHSPPLGYQIVTLDQHRLRQLLDGGAADRRIGSPEMLASDQRSLVAAVHQQRVVSFVWLACHQVSGQENYSRAEHLGTSIMLPPATVFVYNAWTDTDHRGRRLIARALGHAMHHRLLGAQAMVTSLDWTNLSSLKAFEKVGMQRVGTVVRMGWGPCQLSLLPKRLPAGIELAADAPGWRVSL